MTANKINLQFFSASGTLCTEINLVNIFQPNTNINSRSTAIHQQYLQCCFDSQLATPGPRAATCIALFKEWVPQYLCTDVPKVTKHTSVNIILLPTVFSVFQNNIFNETYPPKFRKHHMCPS
jgi:hypothetical protein